MENNITQTSFVKGYSVSMLKDIEWKKITNPKDVASHKLLLNDQLLSPLINDVLVGLH